MAATTPQTGFTGFPPEALKFFRALEKNNNRDWFESNKQMYLLKVRQPMEQLVAAVGSHMMRFAPAYVKEPNKAIYRIYRDTRFSADKTPYKTHIGALFTRPDLPKNESAGFYVALSAKAVSFGGGLYMPLPEHLPALRAHIAGEHERFRKLVTAKRVTGLLGELLGDQLQRPPKGFAPDHPAMDLLKRKQWYFYREDDAAAALKPAFVQDVVKRFKAAFEVVEFLNEPIFNLQRKTSGSILE